MGKCINHPDRETPYICMKHQVYLCEECLQCRDPHIYCKYRTSCPIWFMSKRQKDWDAEERGAVSETAPAVSFLPAKKTVSIAQGSTLLEAAQAAGVHINASCNGKGSCGKCKLIVVSGEVESSPTPKQLMRPRDRPG